MFVQNVSVPLRTLTNIANVNSPTWKAKVDEKSQQSQGSNNGAGGSHSGALEMSSGVAC